MSSKPTARYKTVFISDVHLGTPDSKAKECIDFLKRIRCEKLVLNGDIIDGWHLKRKNGDSWRDAHTKFVRTVLKKMEKEDTEVIYLRGNHDDIIGRFLPFEIGGLKVANEYIHETPQGKYLVVHGDGFDAVTTKCKAVAVLGSVGYDLLLRINRLYNRWRAWRGKEYYSLSKDIKGRVKMAVGFLGRFEDQLQEFARVRHCVGVICGHVHTPNDRTIGSVHYLNSGDWVESLTAIVEPSPGEFRVVEYKQFVEEADAMAAKIIKPDLRVSTPVEPALAGAAV